MNAWTITMPVPAPLMTMNQRLHWTKQRAYARAWRTTANLHTRSEINNPRNPIHRNLPACTITITLPVVGNRRRDPSNWMLTCKHIVDGCVDAGLWSDDTPEYVAMTEPVLEVGGKAVTITLTERPTT